MNAQSLIKCIFGVTSLALFQLLILLLCTYTVQKKKQKKKTQLNKQLQCTGVKRLAGMMQWFM